MSRTYTIRIADVDGPGSSRVYVVPTGYRVIVRGVSYCAYSSPGSTVWLRVHGKLVWNQQVPGSFQAGFADLRLVAYAGEQIDLLTDGANIAAHVTGYLFEDTAGGAELGELPYVEAEPLPPAVTPTATSSSPRAS